MISTDQKITNPHITSDRVRSVPLARAGFQILRDADVVCTGIDERTVMRDWGDGISATILLFWVTHGRVGLGTRQDAVFAEPGELLIVSPPCRKDLFTEDQPLRALWLHVAATSRWRDLLYDQPRRLQSRALSMLDPMLEGMLTESVRNDADGHEACRLLAGLFLHYVRREVGIESDPAQRETKERLSKLWLAVNGDLAGAWSLERMAGTLHVSTGHCHRLVAQHYGVTPMEMLRKLRLERAAELLLSSNSTLDRIAEMVGYGSAYAFSKAFLQRFGCRPGAYRRKG